MSPPGWDWAGSLADSRRDSPTATAARDSDAARYSARARTRHVPGQ